MRRRRRKMWRRTFGRQKVLPRTPFQKTFFRWGRWSPPLDGGERTTARGPGKQKEEGIVAFLFLFWVRMACLACAAYLYGCPVQNKNAEGRVPSAFYVMSAVLFVRDPYLSWPLLPGDRQWGLSGVVPGSPSSCIKRVGGRMGAWGKEGPLRASQRSLLPPSKNPVPLSPISLRRYSESRVMATGMVMTERTVDRLTSRAPKGASVL